MSERVVFILSLFDTGLYTGQLFAKYGYKVVGFDFKRRNVGFHSRKLTAVLTADPSVKPQQVIDVLIKQASFYKDKPILVAASEVFLCLLSDYRAVLSDHFRFTVPSEYYLKRIIRKSGQFELAQKSGLSVPEYIVVDEVQSFDLLNDYYAEYPVIIKGDAQQIWKASGLPKSIIVKTKDELLQSAKHLLDLKVPFIAQSLIAGPVTNNYEYNALAYSGKIVLGSTVKKIRQLATPYGAASCVELCNHETVEALAKKFVLENDIEGFSNTEFKLDPSNGTYYFIECNARVWLQIKLTEHIGKSFVKAYIALIENKSLDYSYQEKTKGIRWVDFPSDLIGCIKEIKSNPLTALGNVISYRHVESYGLLALNDIKPLVYSVFRKWLS